MTHRINSRKFTIYEPKVCKKEPVTIRKLGPRPELTKKENDDLACAFGMFDPRGDGIVPARTLLLALRAMGKEKDFTEVDALIENTTGGSKDAPLDFKAFHKIMQAEMLQDSTQMEVKQAFKIMAGPDSSSIKLEDLENVAEELGSDLTSDELREMIEFADPDKTGSVNFNHFKKILERPMLE